MSAQQMKTGGVLGRGAALKTRNGVDATQVHPYMHIYAQKNAEVGRVLENSNRKC